MPVPSCLGLRLSHRLSALLAAALLSACGGGGGGQEAPPPATCSVADQQDWLARYMDDWYFWTALSPRADAGLYDSVQTYFQALLFGGDAIFPADRWSGTQSTASFSRFYGDGAALGYGVSVAGLEVLGRPDAPLYVRYVEPLSPAASQGIVRGDQVLALNGRSAADVIAANDFAALNASAAGDSLSLRLRNGGVERTVTLTAAVFSLTPVTSSRIVDSPGGRKLGYLLVKDMIGQALAPVDAAFAQFQAAGVADLVLDLRYNGGGLVSVGAQIASYIAGATGSERTYARLHYNDKRAATSDQTFRFANPAAAAGLTRVFVLTGPRTCSASEQVINGLRGIGVEVVTVGDTSCGKPVGFVPQSQCGTTFSVVNFESVNERGEGRYFDGLPATCAVDEDLGRALGSDDEALLAAAAKLADGRACPAVAASRDAAQRDRRRAALVTEPGGSVGMIPR